MENNPKGYPIFNLASKTEAIEQNIEPFRSILTTTICRRGKMTERDPIAKPHDQNFVPN